MKTIYCVLTLVAVSVVFFGAWSVATAADAASKGPMKSEPAGAPMQAVAEKSNAAAVVTITDAGLAPAAVTVKAGQTVEWKNASKADQEVTTDAKVSKTKGSVELPKGARAMSSGDIRPGSSFSHTFAVAGTYKYASIKQGKEGEVIVKAEEVRKAPAKAAPPKTAKHKKK